MRIAPPAGTYCAHSLPQLSDFSRVGDGLRAKALRRRILRRCLQALTRLARQAEAWLAGHRRGLHGLDGLPPASRLGSACPRGPSLRSGKPWGQAHGQVRAGLKASADAALHHALPECLGGRGLCAPRTAGRRLGRLKCVRICPLPAPPLGALPAVGVGQSRGLDAHAPLSGAFALGRCASQSPAVACLMRLAGFAPPSHGLGS